MASDITMHLSAEDAEWLRDHLMFPDNRNMERVHATLDLVLLDYYRRLTSLARDALGVADNAALQEALERMLQMHPTADELIVN